MRRFLGCLLLSLLAGCAPRPAAGPAVALPETALPPAAPARVEPQRDWRDAILYFVVLDRFADGSAANNRAVDPSAPGAFHGGDLAGLTAELDEIAELGVTAIWVTPVVRNIEGFVTGAGFPDWAYHGYWADDFHSLDDRFGTEEELATLVAEAHRRGMKVLLDVVYNHAGYGSRYLSDPATRGWFRSEELGTCGADDLTGCVAGLPDFKTERGEVADYLMDAHLGLASRVGLDGFRLDTVKHVDHAFWRRHRERTRAELGAGFFLLGEVWGGEAASLDAWFAGDEMDAGFDFSFQGSTLAWLQGRGRTVAFARYLESRERVRPGHLLAHFLSSHDVPGALYLLDGDLERFRLAASLQFAVSGIPTVYYGEEVARPGGDWPANRGDMPWGERALRPGAGLPRDEALRAEYRRWIALRRAHRALQAGSHRTLSAEGDLLVFAREHAPSGDAVLVAVNRGAEPARARVAVPAAWTGALDIRDALSGVRWELESNGAELELEVPAKSSRWLVAAR